MSAERLAVGDLLRCSRCRKWKQQDRTEVQAADFVMF